MSTKGLSAEDATIYYQIERATQPPRDRILIVGGRDSNWDTDLREHPDLIFWDSTDPAAHRKQAVPYRVGCVILMEFISHKDTDRLEKLSPPDVRVLKGRLFTTGRVKRILRPLLAARRVAQAGREAATPPAAAREEFAEAPAEAEQVASRVAEKVTPARMMANPAVLEPVVAGIVSAADKDGIVSGYAASQVIGKFTGVEITAQHIKFLARGGYLNPTKSPEGKRYSRYRVMEKAREMARHHAEQIAPARPTDLLGKQLEDLLRRVAALEGERNMIFRRLLPLVEEVMRILTESLVKKS